MMQTKMMKLDSTRNCFNEPRFVTALYTSLKWQMCSTNANTCMHKYIHLRVFKYSYSCRSKRNMKVLRFHVVQYRDHRLQYSNKKQKAQMHRHKYSFYIFRVDYLLLQDKKPQNSKVGEPIQRRNILFLLTRGKKLYRYDRRLLLLFENR